jgi:hypothetical protein
MKVSLFLLGFFDAIFLSLPGGIIEGLFERRDRFEFESIAASGFRSNVLDAEL